MTFPKHDFTEAMLEILRKYFNNSADFVLQRSELIQYLNIKTKAANKGSKSRASYANIYAIYVLIEDYTERDFHKGKHYKDYQGAQFSVLLRRQRDLPFGSKLQNHALNHRLNEEFRKYFPESQFLPIIRDSETNRYWINENLLILDIDGTKVNIAESVKEIIQSYIHVRQKAFYNFLAHCKQMMTIEDKDQQQAVEFIEGLLRPHIDARVFEIVSYAILKEHYYGHLIYWGWSRNELNLDHLILYKTGRTNANDGGIDFVMKPLGRFFQVTETVDAGKYFLDIDKVQRYPITFVVKSEDSIETIQSKIETQARARYPVEAIVKRYMECIEEIINIPEILKRYNAVVNSGRSGKVIKEIVLQSRVEFNVESGMDDAISFDTTES